MKYLLSILILFISLNAFSQQYAVSIEYTPVLNSPDFSAIFGGKSGSKLKTDGKGFIRELEFIALPQTVFEIVNSYPHSDYNILKVVTNDYNYNTDLYIDSRFVNIYDSKPEERKPKNLSKNEIQTNLKKLIGYPYQWGGNYADGIADLLNYYPPSKEISDDLRAKWMLKGVDCSGLIYQSSNGITPRNTSSMRDFGTPVDIKGKSVNTIAETLMPLDLIVIKGHVVIVLDEDNVIESSPNTGVHLTSIKSRLNQLLSNHKADNEFISSNSLVVRRWF